MPAKKKTSAKRNAKPAKKKAAKKVVKKAPKAAKPIGKVTHYYDKIGVGIVKVGAPFKTGDSLCFKGHGKEFVQTVGSLQYNHKAILRAPKGKQVGLKVKKIVKEGDLVFRA